MKPIEFTSNPHMNPLQQNARDRANAFEDLVFKNPYRQRVAKFTSPSTWIRILPALAGSDYAWMMKLRVLDFPGGRLIHPRTFDRTAECPFDAAYQWMAEHHPERLYGKGNPKGIRLLARDLLLAWAIVESEGKPTAKLVLASAWSGGADANPGLGYLLYTTARQLDKNKEVVLDAVDATAGFRLNVHKVRAAGSNRSQFAIEIGRNPAPMGPLMAALSEEDQNVIVRLEDVVERPSATLQLDCLEKALGPDLFREFRTSQRILA